jgi:hypothetical protein
MVVKIVEMIVDNVKARGKIGCLQVREARDLPEQQDHLRTAHER